MTISKDTSYFCLWHTEQNKPAIWRDQQGHNQGPLLFNGIQLAVNYCSEVANSKMKGWNVAHIAPADLSPLIREYGDGKHYWEYRKNCSYALHSISSLISILPRYGMTQPELTPEQTKLAREAWEKIGHYSNPTWEQFERMALSEARVTYQLQVWVCCARAWEKYFENHPQSKSDHAKRLIAAYLLAVSLGQRLKKSPKQWSELVSLYQETAQTMGLPPSSPPEFIEMSAKQLFGWRQ